ncbi:hypothetical protein BELL_0101g00180 [Botrytis elliptica]|uniref:Uncharacterized protein n=1 Tax=Botrytis elliptica TaxID=278938 RepID=A0A4Z1K8G9_9HELO|nr:hypothetical protein BELL_0101g00180 [Botrytis elliptica]
MRLDNLDSWVFSNKSRFEVPRTTKTAYKYDCLERVIENFKKRQVLKAYLFAVCEISHEKIEYMLVTGKVTIEASLDRRLELHQGIRENLSILGIVKLSFPHQFSEDFLKPFVEIQ